ncbi:MAG: AMP-binding protein, partial [Candidatus Binatia bacterium]
MTVATRLTAALASEWGRGGWWSNETFGALLATRARAAPAKTAVVDDSGRLAYGELAAIVDRVATGLAAMGVAQGDTISCIVPNRREAVVLFYAAARLGAVFNPIVPIYGAREIGFIVRQAESRVLVVVDGFRGVDLAALAERLRADVASLRDVVIIGEPRPGMRAWSDLEATPAGALFPAVDPNAIQALLYTSGTTADPKGVLHSHNTLLCECRSMAANHALSPSDVLVMASPVSHISGMLFGIMLPVHLGATSVLMERWDAERFLDLVEREGGTFSAGATPFLQGIVEAWRPGRAPTLRVFPCGGADVPPDLIRRARLELGIRSGRGYGSTEFPSIVSSAGPDVPDERRATTDGRPIPPNVVQLRDEDGQAIAPGDEGEIWARGPELCLGYRAPALNADAFDARGFFRTGDLGRLDAEGWLTITGRVKDIIVRAGEKFSAKEIEDLLHGHPKVRRVAVVPVPDARTGERACACVVPVDPSNPPSLAELATHLVQHEVSRRKLPERLEIVDELPTTASGKVQK